MQIRFSKFLLTLFVFSALIQPATSAKVGANTTNLHLIFKASDPAPVEVGGTFFRLAGAAIGDDGNVAFSASLFDSTVSSALFMKSGDEIRVLLRAGEQAPEGGRYKNFLELDYSSLNLDGEQGAFLLFRAELEGGTASEGLFVWSPDNVKAIALAGGRSPRGRTYRSFAQPTIVTVKPTSGINFIAAFTAVMVEKRKSIIFHADFFPSGISETLSTKDRIGLESVKDFVISRLGGSALSCVVEVTNPSGTRFKRAVTVLNGVIVSGGSVKERGKVPTLGKIKSISSPPAISLQLSFVAVNLGRGITGLIARDVLGDGLLFAKTGDAAPGLPGETIQLFTPPISNPGFPILSPTVLASHVQLSGGRGAIYFFRASGVTPFEGEARLILLEGDSAGPDSVLQNFTLLDLSNNGALLLRGSLFDGSRLLEGLLVMDRLID